MIARASHEVSDEELVECLSVVRSVIREHKRSDRWAIGLRRLGIDEAHSIGAEALVEAREGYSSDAREESSFRGFARFVIKRRLRAAICRHARFPVRLDHEPFYSTDDEPDGFGSLPQADQDLLTARCESNAAELADQMGLSVSAVRRRVQKATDRLRCLLSE